MPGTGKYGTVYSNLKTKKPKLVKLFASDPQYNDYSHDELVKRAKSMLVPAHQDGDLGVFPAGVNLDYSGVPNSSDQVPADYNTVKTSTTEPYKGWPMTAYTPNTMSPGEGNGSDPFKVGDPQITPNSPDLKPNFVPDTDGTISPTRTSAEIGSSTLLDKTEKLVPGKHQGSK